MDKYCSSRLRCPLRPRDYCQCYLDDCLHSSDPRSLDPAPLNYPTILYVRTHLHLRCHQVTPSFKVGPIFPSPRPISHMVMEERTVSHRIESYVESDIQVMDICMTLSRFAIRMLTIFSRLLIVMYEALQGCDADRRALLPYGPWKRPQHMQLSRV
jgi:hypothetical protein